MRHLIAYKAFFVAVRLKKITGKSRLFAARDFFGIKPFYYAVTDGCFVFASEIKSILQFPGCPREVNEEALEQYLSFQYSVLDETFFKGIYKLPPGSFLTYKNGHLEIKRYFSPSLFPKKTKMKEEFGTPYKGCDERGILEGGSPGNVLSG